MSLPSCDGKLCFGCPSCAHHPSTIKAIEFAGGREIPAVAAGRGDCTKIDLDEMEHDCVTMGFVLGRGETSPIVGGLIDRIRELEEALATTLDFCAREYGDAPGVRHLLEKGAVRRG